MKLKNVWKIGVGVLGICISMLFSNVNVVSANEADIMEELETADLQISTARELKEFATKVNNGDSYERKVIKLTGNIKFDDEEQDNFTPIGTDKNRFEGTFDGNGYTISGIDMTGGETAGLFGYIGETGVVKNIKIKDSNMYGFNYAGAIAAKSSGIIDNCQNENVCVSGSRYVGGIVGAQSKGSVQNCISNARIILETFNGLAAGGIAGLTGEDAEINNCANQGNVKGFGRAYVGGISGYGYPTAIMQNCYNVGAVTMYTDDSESTSIAGGISSDWKGMAYNCHSSEESTEQNFINVGLEKNCKIWKENDMKSMNFLNKLNAVAQSNVSWLEWEFCSQKSLYPVHIELMHKHNLTNIEEKLATCTENGSKSYWYCSDCQKKYAEENAETEIQETEIIVPATNHQHTEIRNVKVVTCTENGYTGDTYCLDCNTLLISGQAFAAKGHIWNTGKVTKKPLAAIKGKKTYTCTECGKTKTESIPATGAHKKGTILKKGNYTYKVTKKGLKNGTVAFKGITGNIKNVKIPKAITVEGITYKVTSIEDKALYKNKKVTQITIGENVKTVGADAFTGCGKLKTISVGKGVIFTVGDYKYKTVDNISLECIGLKNQKLSKVKISDIVKIGAKSYIVKSVAEKAFYKNKKITSVFIGKNVNKVGLDAFAGCKNLKKINISKATTIVIGDYKYKITGTSTASFVGVANKKLKKVVIPNRVKIGKNTYKVTAIAAEALKYNKEITSVIMGDSIKNIGDEAFFWCTNLVKVTIGKKVTTLGDNLFRGCSVLKNITIPDSVIIAGQNMFEHCWELKKITMPYELFRTHNTQAFVPEGIELITTGEKKETYQKVFATEYDKVTRYTNGSGYMGYEIVLQDDDLWMEDNARTAEAFDLLDAYLFKRGLDTTQMYGGWENGIFEDEYEESIWGGSLRGYNVSVSDSYLRPIEISTLVDIHGWADSWFSTWPEGVANKYYGMDLEKEISDLTWGSGQYRDFDVIPAGEDHDAATCQACKKYPGYQFEIVLDFEEIKDILGLRD